MFFSLNATKCNFKKNSCYFFFIPNMKGFFISLSLKPWETQHSKWQADNEGAFILLFSTRSLILRHHVPLCAWQTPQEPEVELSLVRFTEVYRQTTHGVYLYCILGLKKKERTLLTGRYSIEGRELIKSTHCSVLLLHYSVDVDECAHTVANEFSKMGFLLLSPEKPGSEEWTTSSRGAARLLSLIKSNHDPCSA